MYPQEGDEIIGVLPRERWKREKEMITGALPIKGRNGAGGAFEREKNLEIFKPIKNVVASSVIQMVTSIGLGERR
jgi:hypothetical protein